MKDADQISHVAEDLAQAGQDTARQIEPGAPEPAGPGQKACCRDCGQCEKEACQIRGTYVAGEATRIPPDLKLLRLAHVEILTGLSKSTIYRFADAGRMPKPIKIGGAACWSRAILERWIENGCKRVR